MFDRLKDWLALTRTERNVILFLSTTLMVGAGIKLYRLTFPEIVQYDYRASDSAFVVLSQAAEQEDDANVAGGIVNINTATKDQLMRLPGVGAVLAERILIYREELGEFTTVNQLLNVKGISKKKLEELKPLVTLH
jgi:competence ComEA-like helix-hairpin-helix protein